MSYELVVKNFSTCDYSNIIKNYIKFNYFLSKISFVKVKSF